MKTTAKKPRKKHVNRLLTATKLWQWLKIALEDVRLLRDKRGYEIYMGYWHQPNGKCKVCLAGATMACEFQLDRKEDANPECFPGFANKLRALNSLRKGYVNDALSYFYSEEPSPWIVNSYIKVPLYGQPGWWKAMNGILKVLKDAEL